jgi:hypothetical protein
VVANGNSSFQNIQTMPSATAVKSCVSLEKLRKNKEALGKLVFLRNGESLQEGYGEVGDD